MRTSNITCQGQRDTETGEPDDAISIKSGSEGGWEKRPAMDLARSLPNLFTLANLRAAPAEGQDNADLALLGLDEPVARVTLYTDRPEPVEAMRFGKRHARRGAVYVRRESTRGVYLVSSDILDELRQPTLSWQSPRGQ